MLGVEQRGGGEAGAEAETETEMDVPDAEETLALDLPR